jgi:membrane carboxypeptidase/penicillin-binding protein
MGCRFSASTYLLAAVQLRKGLEAHDHRQGYRGPLRRVDPSEIDAEVLTLESEEISKYTLLRLGFSEVMSSIKFCHYL